MDATSHSLLDQVRAGPDGVAWRRWHGIYEPLIRNWLKSRNLLTSDADDVAQEVLTVVVRRLPEFDHNGRTGAFRNWLKTITINCLRDHWKKQKQHPRALAVDQTLSDWADPQGALSAVWDREHDQHLVQKVLRMLEPDFAPATWSAFRMLVMEGQEAGVVARALNITPNAVYIAKSRVMTRLRQEVAGLVDDVAPDG